LEVGGKNLFASSPGRLSEGVRSLADRRRLRRVSLKQQARFWLRLKAWIRMFCSPNRFSAKRAVSEIGIQSLPTGRAYASSPPGRLEQRLTGFAGQAPTAPAFQHRASLFHTKERHKEKRKIMVNPLQACLIKAAGRTPPGLTFKLHGLGLNTCEHKKHLFLCPYFPPLILRIFHGKNPSCVSRNADQRICCT
jgi:hypothetical protein